MILYGHQAKSCSQLQWRNLTEVNGATPDFPWYNQGQNLALQILEVERPIQSQWPIPALISLLTLPVTMMVSVIWTHIHQNQDWYYQLIAHRPDEQGWDSNNFQSPQTFNKMLECKFSWVTSWIKSLHLHEQVEVICRGIFPSFSVGIS